ncbi:MAG: hypothetical protein L3J66_03540 [Bacteroidales bacterium]|nr:hypothetical protein [Bacteroidales bacterium]
MKKFWLKLKERWEIESDRQVALILTVFALTGFSFLFVSPYVEHLLGLTEEDPFWLKAVVFVVIMLPIYNLLLIAWGTLLGQFRFFRSFIIRFFKRLLFIKTKKRGK